jgi:hypothetical protein
MEASSPGMDASSHFGAALSGDRRAMAGAAHEPDTQPELGGHDYCERDPIDGSEREDDEAEQGMCWEGTGDESGTVNGRPACAG